MAWFVPGRDQDAAHERDDIKIRWSTPQHFDYRPLKTDEMTLLLLYLSLVKVLLLLILNKLILPLLLLLLLLLLPAPARRGARR